MQHMVDGTYRYGLLFWLSIHQGNEGHIVEIHGLRGQALKVDGPGLTIALDVGRSILISWVLCHET